MYLYVTTIRMTTAAMMITRGTAEMSAIGSTPTHQENNHCKLIPLKTLVLEIWPRVLYLTAPTSLVHSNLSYMYLYNIQINIANGVCNMPTQCKGVTSLYRRRRRGGGEEEERRKEGGEEEERRRKEGGEKEERRSKR